MYMFVEAHVFLAKRTTQRQTLKAEMVYKFINGLVPEYFTRKFIQRSDANPYNLRDFENKLAIPLPRTNYLKNSFSYSSATL